MPRRHAACVVLVALLAGCASPAPQPDGAPRTEEVAPRFAADGPEAEVYGCCAG